MFKACKIQGSIPNSGGGDSDDRKRGEAEHCLLLYSTTLPRVTMSFVHVHEILVTAK